jgi:hypothetical protein
MFGLRFLFINRVLAFTLPGAIQKTDSGHRGSE